MSELPTQAEELERKATQAITHAASRLSLGQITGQEFWALVDGVYDTVSGLVPKSVSDWILALRKAKLEPFTERRVLAKPPEAKVIVIERAYGASSFTMKRASLVDGVVQTDCKDFDAAETPSASCAEAITSLVNALTTIGWREL